MRFISIFCFLSLSLFADTIADVEYQSPNLEGWDLVGDFEGKEGKALIYSRITEDGTEYFGATNCPISTEIPNLAALEEELQKLSPGSPLTVSILETSPTSILYSWEAPSGKELAIHGLCRTFSTEKGTTGLVYMNRYDENPERPIWLKILQEAKLIE
ncbi:MAG TPA: hypothetical protein VLE89_02280 [Chlamydiales bacterium]|nr:hypothetical protein [Chlamydiales bacterium]